MYTIIIKGQDSIFIVGNWPEQEIVEAITNFGIENVLIISTYSNTIKVPTSIENRYCIPGEDVVEFNEFNIPTSVGEVGMDTTMME